MIVMMIAAFSSRRLAIPVYKYGKANRKIPATISVSLGRKLDMLNAADKIGDLRSPRGTDLKISTLH